MMWAIHCNVRWRLKPRPLRLGIIAPEIGRKVNVTYVKPKKAPSNPMILPDVPGTSSRCRAITASGRQCKGWVRFGGFCHIHDPQGTYQNSGKTKRTLPVIYRDYLRSEHWLTFRSKALEHYGYRCANCQAKREDVTLDVHHLTYETLWHETVDDVLVVCRKCHIELTA